MRMDRRRKLGGGGHPVGHAAVWVCIGTLALTASACLAELYDRPVIRLDTSGHSGHVSDLRWTRDGDYVIASSWDKTIRIWDWRRGRTVRVLRWAVGPGPYGKVYAIAVSPDGNWLAAGGNWPALGECRVAVWHLPTGRLARVLKGHTNSIFGLAFSPDGSFLASASGDRTVRLWRMPSGELVRVLKGHTDGVNCVAFSPDGRRLVSGSWDSTLRLWRVEDGKCLAVMRGHEDWVWDVEFSPDGRYIASVSVDGTVRLWDGRTGKAIKTLARFEERLYEAAFSPDGSRVVVGGWAEGCACIVLSVPDGRKLLRFHKHSNAITGLAWSPDGRLIASAGGDRSEIYVWKAGSGEVVRRMQGCGAVVWAVGWSGDGRRVAFGWTHDYPGPNRLGPLERWFDLARLATGQVSDESAWRQAVARRGDMELEWEGLHRHRLFLKRGGRTIATVENRPGYEGWVRSYSFTPDGRFVVGSECALRLYDASGSRVRSFVGHEGAVWAVAVSPDGRYLASASNDQTVRIWNIDTGELLLTLFMEAPGEGGSKDIDVVGRQRWIIWTPQGYYAASPGGDELAGWHINRGIEQAAEWRALGQYGRKLYRPDIIKLVLRYGSVEKAAEAANRIAGLPNIDPQELLAEHRPPEVRIVRPRDGDVVREGSVEVAVEVRSGGGDRIERVTILVNGRPVVRERDVSVEAAGEGGGVVMVRRRVMLSEGENVIAAQAATKWATSRVEEVRVVYKPRRPELMKPACYVLAIGVSRYRNARYNLRYAAADAEAIAEAFREHGRGLFREVRTRVLTDEEATRANVIRGFRWLCEEATQRDLAVAFVAGHGVRDESGFYFFVPHDGEVEDMDVSCVSWEALARRLANLPAKVLLLLDTCHAGAMAVQIARLFRSAEDLREFLRLYERTEVGVVVLAATTAGEGAAEDMGWGHGAFTRAVVDGLGGDGDLNGDGVVTVAELYCYCTERVKELTGGKQHVVINNPKGLPALPLGRR